MQLSNAIIFFALCSPVSGFTASHPSRPTYLQTKLSVASSNDDCVGSNNSNANNINTKGGNRVARTLKTLKKVAMAPLIAATLLVFDPRSAMASAPVTPIKNFKPPDSKAIALKKINDERNREKMKEEMAYQIKCDEIEEAEGKAARIAYEKLVQDKKIVEAEQRSLNRRKLLYSLIEEGICPFADVEGERQIYIFDHGIDLNKVPATTQQKEMMNLRRDHDQKLAKRREKERYIVKCIVQDQILQGKDPLEYLENNQQKTKEVMNFKDRHLDAIVARYQELVSTQGSISGDRVDKPFDMMAATGIGNSDDSKKSKITTLRGGETIAVVEEEAAIAKAVEAALEEADAEIEAVVDSSDSLPSENAELAPGEADEDKMDTEICTLENPAIGNSIAATNIKSTNTPLAPIAVVVGAGSAGYVFIQNSKEAEERELLRKTRLDALVKAERDALNRKDEMENPPDALLKLIQKNAIRKPEIPTVPDNKCTEDANASDLDQHESTETEDEEEPLKSEEEVNETDPE